MKIFFQLYNSLFFFLLFGIFTNCFKAKRAPWDSSSPEGLVRNVIFQTLRIPPLPQNQAPIIKNFTVNTRNVNFGAQFQMTWEVEDPDGDAVTCELDLEPDGVIDYTDPNCSTATLNFSLEKVGTFTPTLKVSDATHQVESPLAGEPMFLELGGGLDSSFVSESLTGDIKAILVRPDGKILVTTYDYSDSYIYLLGKNGDLENSQSFSGLELNALALQSDGKILLSGVGGSDPYYYEIYRLLPDFSNDTSFGSGGSVQIWNDNNFKTLEAIGIDATGKIILVGSYYYQYAVIRLQSNGNLDTSFGTGGMKNFTADVYMNYLYGLSILSNGKILVSGQANDSSYNGRFVLARLNSDGSLDGSFGTGGIAKYNFTVAGTGRKHVIQKDGKIIMCGSSTIDSKDAFALVRFQENGSIDTSFGTGGVVTTQIGSQNTRAYSVFLQEDGKILVTGETNNGASIPIAIRYHSNGSLDTNFGIGGKYIHNTSGDSKTANLDLLGRLILPVNGASDTILIRLK